MKPREKLKHAIGRLRSYFVPADRNIKLNRLDKVFVVSLVGMMSVASLTFSFGVGWLGYRALGIGHAEGHLAAHSAGHGDAHGQGGRDPAGESDGESDDAHEGSGEHGEAAPAADAHGGGHDDGHGGGKDDGHGGGHDAAPVFTQPSIPDSIEKAQDGIPEEGHDLGDQEVTEARGMAGLANLVNKDLVVSAGMKFVEVPDIIADVRNTKRGDVVVATVVIVVPNYEMQKEVELRLTEFKALITSIISEHRATDLTGFKGIGRLKMEIQEELNKNLKNGEIHDILFSDFALK